MDGPQTTSTSTAQDPFDFSTISNYRVADMATDPDVSPDKQGAAIAEYNRREAQGIDVLGDPDGTNTPTNASSTPSVLNVSNPTSDTRANSASYRSDSPNTPDNKNGYRDEQDPYSRYQEYSDRYGDETVGGFVKARRRGNFAEEGRMGQRPSRHTVASADRGKANQLGAMAEYPAILRNQDRYERLNSAENKASFRLKKFLQDYYTDGFLQNLAFGFLEIKPKEYILSGFSHLEYQSISAGLSEKDDRHLWRDINTSILPSVLRANRLDDKDSKNIKAFTKNAALVAISDGVYDTSTSLDEPETLQFSLPIDTKGDGALQSYLDLCGASVESQDAQIASYSGFINIAEKIASNEAFKQQGFKALDWYYNIFNYRGHVGEFLIHIEGYYSEANQAFREIIDEFLASKPEIEKFKAEQRSKDDGIIKELANFEQVTPDELLRQIANHLEDNTPMFVSADGGSKPTERPKKVARLANSPTAIEKCTMASQKIEQIREIDPNFTCYTGTVFREGSGGPNNRPYVIIRFGYNDYNNVIAVPIGDSSAAMFCWRGQTGEDAEGWREYFRNASIRGRNSSIHRFVCNGYTKDGEVALGREWGRMEKDLGINLSGNQAA